ncbi:MAG: GntR family transcriptional regulator [Lachnospiraceae bacterium]|nr:GntR family transcriptional regulator [Lachnospiraceae bacterium]MBQ4309008.1 GntR family transcriptional regulator [Lachnospiraceae bacterium]MBQ9464369.1 GntR family transcriptional regulator [Lachnospiraceae bacterium]MBR0106305.1 GntR family transcriptional regulator [Lachnospiraceae bacterium]MBR2739042.1 GntR family transcriptional regulator [Lachnospiraceae bacterium]
MIKLNYRDTRPIYEQVKDDLRRLVISGAIREGEKIPSVRELAVRLSINPNTIQRAYRDLEQEGYIYMISGKGSFAAPLKEVSAQRKEEVGSVFEEVVRELLSLGCSPEELKERIEKLAEGGVWDDPGQ